MPHTETHPSREALAGFLAGRLALPQQRGIEAHVAACDACCRVLESLPEDTLIEQLRSAATPIACGPRSIPLDELPIPDELKGHPRYEVRRAIGAGGMGVAWLAVHRRMNRPVVLKVIHRELISNPAAVRRFQVEVQAAARLSHPHIVQAHDADQAGPLHFLVMEYVEGESLAAVVAGRGPLPPALAADYIRQAAAGLQHAHQRGMVHRDIKPQNLMLTPEGQVKILDFGLAQLVRDLAPCDDTAPLAAAHRTGTLVTAAGAVFGTPDYIAPEQAASSRDVDIRADIYSLGCTLYYLLRGEPPFAGRTLQEKLAAHRESPVPSLASGAEPLPEAWDRILQRMTAKHPSDRYPAPADVVQALEPLASSSRHPAPPPAPPVVVTPPPVVGRSGQTADNGRPGAAVAASLSRAAVADRLAFRSQGSLGAASRHRRRAWTLALAAALAAGVVAATAWIWQADKKAAQPSAPPAAGRAAPVVLVLLSPQFSAVDYAEVRRVLERDARARVRVAATGPCRSYDSGRENLLVQPDLLLSGEPLRAADFDALYIPGGNIHPYKDDTPIRRTVWKLMDELLAAGKPVAALGLGQGVLAMHGTLVGRKVAVNPQVRQFIPALAGEPTGQMVSVDGPLITGAESRAATALGEVLAAELSRRQSAPSQSGWPERFGRPTSSSP